MKKLLWTIFCFTPIIANVVTCQVPETLTKACLYLEQGNWQEAWRATSILQGKLGKKETCSGDPVARLLHGHTALAAGKYDEAMNQFYCDCDSLNAESLTKWQAFCQELVSRNPTRSSAHYLLGDALARLEKYDGATQEFTKAIELFPGNFLARNARGVNEWIVSKSNGETMCLRCTGDWDTTLMLKPDMADALVNKGVSFLLVGGDVSRCISLFNKSIAINPNFSLAYNGIKVSFHLTKDDKFYDVAPLARNTPFAKLDSMNLMIDSVKETRGVLTIAAMIPGPQQPIITGLRFATEGNEVIHRINNEITKIDNASKTSQPFYDNNIYKAVKGGVYSIQIEGYNKETINQGLPSVSGTWFLLNYPSKNWKI